MSSTTRLTAAVLVTGGSRGIGRAICQRLARDGRHVLINYRAGHEQARETLDTIVAAGGQATLCPFDVCDRAGCHAAITALQQHYTIEVLVHSAGVRSDQLLVFMEGDEWDRVVQSNLTGLYNVAQPVVKAMMLRRSGRIIIISSTSGESGVVGQVHYAASKAGLIGAMKSMALECAKRGVLVNAITPGFITTDMTADMDETQHAAIIPLKRFGTPEEVAGTAAFLAGPDATYITGQVIRVNGGVYL